MGFKGSGGLRFGFDGLVACYVRARGDPESDSRRPLPGVRPS